MKSIAIIGAGPAGLAMGKALRDVGLKARIFDGSGHLGGMWAPHSQHCRPSMRTNISKHTHSFSDHPWPEGVPTFPTASQVAEYLGSYAQKFQVAQDITLGCRVTHVSVIEDDKWDVTWSISSPDSAEGNQDVTERNDVFDFLVVATGFFTRASTPNIHGLDEFNGTVIHSAQYRDSDLFKGKRIVVIGDSFSAGEVAGDLVPYASHITQVVPRPFWIFTRYVPVDSSNPASPFVPMDFPFSSQNFRSTPHEVLFPSDEDMAQRNAHFQKQFGEVGRTPTASPEEFPPYMTISDTHAEAIRGKKITIRNGRVASVRGNTVFLSDGSSIQEVDAIIIGTGFDANLDFLELSILDKISYDPRDKFVPVQLYHTMYHPDIPTCAFVGMYRSAFMNIIELQARQVAGVISGRLSLPSRDVQLEGIAVERGIKDHRPRAQFPHPDYVGLSNDLYAKLGEDLGSSNLNPMITAAYYRPDNAFAQIMREELDADIEASQRGKWVAAAVFRALQGTWNLSRRLESADKTYPSGDLKGSATFSLTATNEYSYAEEGEFVTDTGIKLETKRQYIYKYDESVDVINVFFNGGSDGTGFFHQLRFLPPDEEISFPPPISPKAGWRAVGDHLCIDDFYSSFYDFAFSGVNLTEFGVAYEVKGPQKDYVLAARYTR